MQISNVLPSPRSFKSDLSNMVAFAFGPRHGQQHSRLDTSPCTVSEKEILFDFPCLYMGETRLFLELSSEFDSAISYLHRSLFVPQAPTETPPLLITPTMDVGNSPKTWLIILPQKVWDNIHRNVLAIAHPLYIF